MVIVFEPHAIQHKHSALAARAAPARPELSRVALPATPLPRRARTRGLWSMASACWIVLAVALVSAGCRGPEVAALPADAPPFARDDARHCDRGAAEACSNLAGWYDGARPVDDSEARAEALYRRACDAHADLACVNLGAMLAARDGNEAQALDVLERACQRSEVVACWRAAELRVHGPSEVRDLHRGVQHLTLACHAHLMGACVALGRVLLHNDELSSDPQSARAHFERACERVHPEGCFEVASFDLEADVHGAARELAWARMERACVTGFPAACHRMSAYFLHEGDAERAAFFTRVACEQGDADACAAP